MISSLYPSVGTVVPYMIGNLDCFVLFTTYPTRREFRCPLYRVFGHRHEHHTYKLTTYNQNKEYSIVTLNMNDLSDI
jgi:hypothetical protein